MHQLTVIQQTFDPVDWMKSRISTIMLKHRVKHHQTPAIGEPTFTTINAVLATIHLDLQGNEQVD